MATEAVVGTAVGGLVGEEWEPASRSAPGSQRARPWPRGRRLIRLPRLSFMAIPSHTLTRYTAIRHDPGRLIHLRDNPAQRPRFPWVRRRSPTLSFTLDNLFYRDYVKALISGQYPSNSGSPHDLFKIVR